MTEDEITSRMLNDGFVAGRDASNRYVDTPTWITLCQALKQLHEITSADPPALAYPRIIAVIGVLSVAARKALIEMDNGKVASA